jgi:hypothetical protein
MAQRLTSLVTAQTPADWMPVALAVVGERLEIAFAAATGRERLSEDKGAPTRAALLDAGRGLHPWPQRAWARPAQRCLSSPPIVGPQKAQWRRHPRRQRAGAGAGGGGGITANEISCTNRLKSDVTQLVTKNHVDAAGDQK